MKIHDLVFLVRRARVDHPSSHRPVQQARRVSDHGGTIKLLLFRSLSSGLKRSQPALQSISSRPTPLAGSPKSLVKLIHINGTSTGFRRLPLVFVHHDRTILMPAFNICTLLNTINAHVDIHSIEDYVRTDASIDTTSLDVFRLFSACLG